MAGTPGLAAGPQRYDHKCYRAEPAMNGHVTASRDFH